MGLAEMSGLLRGPFLVILACRKRRHMLREAQGCRLPGGKRADRAHEAGFAPAFGAASLWSRWQVLLEFICGFLHLFGMRVFS